MDLADALRRQYRSGGVARFVLAVPAALRRRKIARDGRTAREIMVRLGRSLVDDVVLDVPEFEGQFCCSPRSDIFARIATSGAYEPALAKLFRDHIDPRRDIVDVGANLGFYSVLAAKRNPGRRVLAIEPNPEARRRLQFNLQRNGVEQAVTVFAGLASDRAGTAELNLIEGMEEYSSIGTITHAAVAGKASQRVTVQAATLDELVERHGLAPGLVKIDVEGAEGLVLAGARETIRRYSPVIVAEFSPALLRRMGADPQAILASLRADDYRVIDAEYPQTDPAGRDYGDILCIPA